MDENNREIIQEEQTQELPMKWYNFIVKFYMIFCGVIDIICGVIVASTILHSVMAEYAGVEFAEYVYTGNKAFDIVCGVLLILLGVANLVVRSRMKKFTVDALKKYYALIIAEQALFYIYDIAFALVTNTKLDIADTVVFSLATAVVWVVLEMYYFNKRRALFVN